MPRSFCDIGSRRRSSRRRRTRSARCCRGPWSSGRSPPCRRTRCRSRAPRSNPSPRIGRPGTCRSKVGCEAIDEPCTNRMVPAGPDGSPRVLVPQEQPHVVALVGPVLLAADHGGRRNGLVHVARLRRCRSVTTRCVAAIAAEDAALASRRSRVRPYRRPRNAAADGSAPAAPGRMAASRNIR